jgi:hypothetical protein
MQSAAPGARGERLRKRAVLTFERLQQTARPINVDHDEKAPGRLAPCA